MFVCVVLLLSRFVVFLFCLCLFFLTRCFHFNKFAGGAPTISEEDFARVLLRHTTWDLNPVFERLKRKAKPETVSGVAEEDVVSVLHASQNGGCQI